MSEEFFNTTLPDDLVAQGEPLPMTFAKPPPVRITVGSPVGLLTEDGHWQGEVIAEAVDGTFVIVRFTD